MTLNAAVTHQCVVVDDGRPDAVRRVNITVYKHLTLVNRRQLIVSLSLASTCLAALTLSFPQQTTGFMTSICFVRLFVHHRRSSVTLLPFSVCFNAPNVGNLQLTVSVSVCFNADALRVHQVIGVQSAVRESLQMI